MMIEVPNVRQIPGEGVRRWFSDEYFDLIVWYGAERIVGFQLCYDRDGRPRAFTWTAEEGARHQGIDDGDDPLLSYKATPVLVEDGPFDVAQVTERFKAAARSLPDCIRELVLDRVR